MHPFFLALALVLPDGATAQASPDTTRWIGSHRSEQRWIHARQVAHFTGLSPSAVTLRLDSMAVDRGRAYWFTLTGRQPRPGALRITADGRPAEAWLTPPAMIPDLRWPMRTPGSELRALTAGDAALLDDTRLWGVAPFTVPPLRAGATVQDTLRLRVERFGFVQALEGPRILTLQHDTIVDGRRLWIGRDSARIRYRERVLLPRRSLDTIVVMDREVTGTWTGRFLYDPGLGLFRTRHDTLVGSGTATLRLPDGRTYTTPVRHERFGAWTLRSRTEQAAWEAEASRRRAANAFSIVHLPRTPLEQRIAAGDTAAADSLIRAWATAAPRERWRIADALQFGGRAARQRLDSLRLEAGGWIARIDALADDVWSGRPVDSAAMAEYLRILADPGLALAHGYDPDPAYENLAGGLALNPPTLGTPPDRVSCTPAACRMVAAQRDAAEPRLRQVALVASFILEPERWADSLLSRSDTASHLLRPAVLLARGVGEAWPFADTPGIPDADADWREWLRWTGTDLDDPQRSRGRLPLRFQSSHRNAIRMTERLTGRDIGAELAAAAERARGDSARVVFRTLALHLGALTPTLEEVVAGLTSPDINERGMAGVALRTMEAPFEPADSALRHEIIGQLLAQVLGGDSLWVPGPDVAAVGPVGPLGRDPAAPLFLDPENIPLPVLRRWRDAGVTVISQSEWRARPARLPGLLLRVSDVRALGPLVRVELERWVREARDPERAPSGWASGVSYLLLRTPEGWRIISGSVWVT